MAPSVGAQIAACYRWDAGECYCSDGRELAKDINWPRKITSRVPLGFGNLIFSCSACWVMVGRKREW